MKEKSIWKLRSIAAVAIAIGGTSLAYAGTAPANDLSGRWAGTIQEGSFEIPFRLYLAVDGNTVVGKLYNGWEDYETTSSARIENGRIQLNFEHYLTSMLAASRPPGCSRQAGGKWALREAGVSGKTTARGPDGMPRYLEATDRCFYIWERMSRLWRPDYAQYPVNGLISNLQIPPSCRTSQPKRFFWKEKAIKYAA